MIICGYKTQEFNWAQILESPLVPGIGTSINYNQFRNGTPITILNVIIAKYRQSTKAKLLHCTAQNPQHSVSLR